MANPVETWKAEKHGLDVWPDILNYANAKTPMKEIPAPDLERMKWHGIFYRKRDKPGSYMLRIRLTGGEFTAEQARAIAFVAYEFGYGIVDVTTRANVQVQGLAIENVPKAIERLRSTGLDIRQTGHDNIRNVFGHPLSGLDPGELIDTRQHCQDVTSLFLGSHKYSDLPRKFNIAFCGRPEASVHYWTQDLSLIAHRRSTGEVGYLPVIAGKQGQTPSLGLPLPYFVRPEQVTDLTRVLLDLFREKGKREKRDQSRFRFLVDDIGLAAVTDYVQSNLIDPLEPVTARPGLPAGYEDLVGWFPQKQTGYWAMGVCVPLGRLTWQQLEGLAIASKKWGDGTLRATVEQGIILPNIPTVYKDAAATDAARLRLSIYADSISRSVVACTGKQFCNIAVTETKGHAFKLIEELRKRTLTLHGIRIHMSGCPSSCAMHYSADIGLKGVRVRRLLGTREGFDVFLAGGVSGGLHLAIPYRLGVDVDQLPQLIEEVVEEYYLHRRPVQTFSDYWREKLKDGDASPVSEEEYQVATWECESCGHTHRGEDPPVFCPICSALRRHFARLESTEGETHAEVAPQAASEPVLIGKLADLVPGTGKVVEVAGVEVAVFRIGEDVVAVENQCPHAGGPLAEGTVEGNVVTCPWHSWSFDLCTGCSIKPAGKKLRGFEAYLDEGNVFIKPIPTTIKQVPKNA